MDHKLSIDLVLQSKHKSLLGASRMTREPFIIMAKKTNILAIVNDKRLIEASTSYEFMIK
jgi:hypothetical protein